MNWGNKLLLVIIVFVSGMSYLVYRSTQTNYELVENDYYKQELRYQEVIDGGNAANALSSSIQLQQTGEGIHLSLPEEMKNKSVTGNVWFYCAYNSAKDKKFSLQTNAEGIQSFPLRSVGAGNYTVRISWKENGKNYYAEQKMEIL